MDYSPPGSSVHGILQAGILEWIPFPSPGESSWPRDWTHVSCIAGRFFATEPPGKPISSTRHHKNDFLLNLFKLFKKFHPFLPPTLPPSHLATTNLFSVSVNLVYIPHIGTIICLSQSDLTSLSMIPLSLHMLWQMATFPTSIWLNSIPLYILHNFSIDVSISGYLGCFHISYCKYCCNNMRVHTSFWIHVFLFFRLISRSGIARLYDSSIFHFLRKSSIVVTQIYIPTNRT